MAVEDRLGLGEIRGGDGDQLTRLAQLATVHRADCRRAGTDGLARRAERDLACLVLLLEDLLGRDAGSGDLARVVHPPGRYRAAVWRSGTMRVLADAPASSARDDAYEPP